MGLVYLAVCSRYRLRLEARYHGPHARRKVGLSGTQHALEMQVPPGAGSAAAWSLSRNGLPAEEPTHLMREKIRLRGMAKRPHAAYSVTAGAGVKNKKAARRQKIPAGGKEDTVCNPWRRMWKSNWSCARLNPTANALKQTVKAAGPLRRTPCSLNPYGQAGGEVLIAQDGARGIPGRRHRADGERGRAVRAGGAGPCGPTAGGKGSLAYFTAGELIQSESTIAAADPPRGRAAGGGILHHQSAAPAY